MEKIAILSDIHGNIPALEAVVDDFERRGVESVINLGDNISGPLWPKETIEYLMKQNWTQILGNHDRYLFELNRADLSPSDSYAFPLLNESELEWLKTLPTGLKIHDKFLLFHGTPLDDNSYLLETVEDGRARLATPDEIIQRLGKIESSILICGHSHIPRVVELPDNRLIINPGSIGLPAYDDVLPEYYVMETGSPHARYAILEGTKGNWVPKLIAVPYDYKKAAEQAQKNDRPDWEIGILTGFMGV